MPRRTIAGGVATTLVMALLVACGGSEATPTPSAEAPTVAPATQAPAATPATTPTPAPSAPGSERVTMLAVCAGVAIRKGPTLTDEVLVRAVKLTKVRVVGTVTGDPYDGGTCGTSGADWIQIDRINGKSVKKLYGAKYAYAAAGFFQ